MIRFRSLTPVIAAALAAWAFGCAPPADPVVAVSGTATCGGKAVPDLQLHFVPEKGASSVGTCDAEGRFRLNQMTGRTGAAVGTHRVWVEYRPASNRNDPDGAKRSTEGDPPAAILEILRKYGNSQSSPLTVAITGTSANLDLKLD